MKEAAHCFYYRKKREKDILYTGSTYLGFLQFLHHLGTQEASKREKIRGLHGKGEGVTS